MFILLLNALVFCCVNLLSYLYVVFCLTYISMFFIDFLNRFIVIMSDGVGYTHTLEEVSRLRVGSTKPGLNKRFTSTVVKLFSLPDFTFC